MNNSLSLSKLIPVSLVLFSSFFGAGNLLFPPLFGYLAGSNLNIATLGFCITGVSLPILGVLAITAAFSYEIGIKPLLGTTEAWQLALYSALYFAFSFYVANNPSKVLNWLGKILTPALLVCLAVLFVKVLLAPSFVPGAPQDAYLNTPFLKGFQEGYNTMDLLASFLFGAATLTSIKTLGIEGKKNLIRTCLCAGLIAAALLAVIYYFLGYAGAEAHRYLSGEFSNGAGILVATAHEYLGAGGTAILSAIIILACLTTSIGLIAAIADYFHILFNQKLSKKTMGFLVALLSFLLSNFGLDMIIKMAIPVLCFLYPVMIALALLNVFGFGGNKRVFRCTMWIVTLFAVVEGLKAAAIPVPMESILASVPLYTEGFGWFTVAVIGAAVGVIWDKMKS